MIEYKISSRLDGETFGHKVEEFEKDFREKTGCKGTLYASLGYDSIMGFDKGVLVLKISEKERITEEIKRYNVTPIAKELPEEMQEHKWDK